ncbi:hypothetical protein HHI36_001927, partial [Cryptolaemus montrouzieri]
MKPKEQKNIYSSIVLVNVISSIMGIFPTNNIMKNGVRIGRSNPLYRYWVTVFITCIYTFCLIAANVGKDIFTSKKQYDFNKIAYLLYVATVITAIFSVYVQYALTLYGTPLIIHMLETVRKSDNLIAKIGYRFKYKAGFIINFVIITSGMYFITFNTVLEVWNSTREDMGSYSFFEIVVICWPQFVIHVLESEFMLSGLMLFTRFFAVNLIVETLFKNNGGKHFLRDPPNFLSRTYNFVKHPDASDEYALYCVMKSHYALFRISVVHNNTFGVILTFSALIQFTTIAFAICFCYYKWNEEPGCEIYKLKEQRAGGNSQVHEKRARKNYLKRKPLWESISFSRVQLVQILDEWIL